jgi:large subunit ribosomal protein L10
VERARKDQAIESLKQTFSDNPHVIVASFNGLTVNQSNSLRRTIGAAGGKYQVIKNRLAKRAAVGTPLEALSAEFEGPCAVATHCDDPIVLAKAVAEFMKDNPQITVKAGLIDAKDQVDSDGVIQLSKMPGLPELRAQLLALFNTPATTLVRLLGTPGTQVVRVIDARREAQAKEGDGGE